MQKIVHSFLIGMLLSMLSAGALAQNAILTLQEGHNNPVTALSLNNSADYLISGSADNTIKLWNTKTGRLIRTFSGHSNIVNAVSFTPDESMLVSASADKSLILWDFNTGKSVRQFTGHEGSVTSAVFHPNGKVLFSGSWDGKVNFYNVQTGQQVLSVPIVNGRVLQLAISKNGNILVAACSDGNLRLLRTDNGALITEMRGHADAVSNVQFSPNGNYVLSGSIDNTLKLWDAATGKNIRTFKQYESSLSGLAFSASGTEIISSSERGQLVFWETESGKLLRTIETGKQSIALKTEQNGKSIYISEENSIKSFDLANGNLLNTYRGQSARVNEVALSTDNRYIAIAQQASAVNIIDLKTGNLKARFNAHNGSVEGIRFSPNNDILITVGKDGFIRYWETEKFTLIREEVASISGMSSVAFREDGKYFVTGNYDNEIEMRETATGRKMRTWKGHSEIITDVAFSPDGRKAAGASWDGTVKIWDAAGANLDPIVDVVSHSGEIWAVAFSPDSKFLATGGSDKLIRVWDAENGALLKTLQGHTDYVSALQFNNSGTQLISGSWDKTVIVWDLANEKPIKQLIGHNNYIRSIAIDNSNTLLLTGSSDSKVMLWNLNSGNTLLSMVLASDTEDRVVTSAQGFFEGTENGIRNGLHYVKGTQIIPLEALYEKFYMPGLWATILKGEKLKTPQVNLNDAFKMPPLVKLTIVNKDAISSENGELMSKQQILQITVEATDQGGGIDEILLYHNGKLLQTTQRGFKPLPVMGETKSKTFDVSLVSGKNTLTATALNNERTEAFPVEIIVNYSGIRPQSDLYIVSVGINNYKNATLNLNYAIADMEHFTGAMQNGSASIFKNIIVKTLQDKDFTKEKIVALFTELQTTVQPEDVFIFYYAGHGAMSSAESKQQEKFYLIPYNITQIYGNDDMLQKHGISSDELMQYATAIKAQKQLLILDACQSGGAVKSFAGRGASEQKAIIQLARSTGMVLLAASGSEQYATEVGEIGHGIFTYALVEGLNGKADGGDKDGKITVNELKSFLDDRVPELSEKYKGSAQYPTGFAKGMDFPISIIR
ncbi:MAG TPA: hypothetical protein DCQ31_08000 [Bacteroidales bacterium]|nr:hypothetical protein [Bacteroidales bacterium]